MGQKQRGRLEALHEAGKCHFTQKQAAEELGLTERHVRRLVARLRSVRDRVLTNASACNP
jgi:DNA-binding transcriptional regulator LsrR (DeoR family)